MSGNGHFVLGVDLDGVCADYQSAIREVIAHDANVDPASLGPQSDWSFVDSHWPVRDEEHYLELHRRHIIGEQRFASLDPIAGASDTLWRLSDAGVHIRIVTHRLYISWEHADVVAQTVTWLQQERGDGRPLIPYRDLCFMGDKTDVGADLYVDDAPHNVYALRERHADVIIFDQPYNQSMPGLRAHDWSEVEEIVLERVKQRGLLG